MFGFKISKIGYGILLILLIVAIVYNPVLHAYFQQDEWPAFAIYFAKYGNTIKSLIFLFRPNVDHYVPLSDSLYLILNKIFGLEYIGYAVISVFMHLLCVYLVYVLASNLFKNKYLGLLSSLFFGINDSGHQATSWIAATFNTNGATIFGLLSLIFFHKFITSSNLKKNYQIRNFVISILFLIVSILFKEISVGLFVFYLFILYFSNRIKIKDKRKYLLSLFTLSFVYGLLRIIMLFASRSNVEEKVVTESQSFVDILKNLITFPAKIFSQSIIPTPFLLSISKSISSLMPSSLTGVRGTTAFDIFSQQIVVQTINWILFLTGVVLIIYLFGKLKDRKIFNILFFSFVFIVINSFIYVLSPGRGGNIPTVDSRNIYFSSIGTSLFLSALYIAFVKNNRLLVYGIFIFLIGLNVFWLNSDLRILASDGQERSQILYQIKHDYPHLPEKVVFYTESDKAYYGLPENEKIFPFQVNFGYTLLIYYFPSQHYSWNFLELGGYLYNFNAQGYKEDNGVGFGYFRDFNLLVSTFKQRKLFVNSIIAYRYNSNSKKLLNITDDIRAKVYTALQK